MLANQSTKNMILPNFLIIGAQKSGTTSLYNYLKQHPKVYMSPLKEPHFFSYGLSQTPTKWSESYGNVHSPIMNREDYQSLFQKVADETAIGEASTSYLYHPDAAERIHHYLPNVKLIAILRDPAKTTYSKFLMDYRQQYDRFSQDNLIDDFAQEIQKYSSHQESVIYSKTLKSYVDLFAREQIKIYLFEDLKADSDSLMQDCFQFLGVDDNFHIDQSLVYNSGGIPKNKIIYISLEKMRSIFNTTLKPAIPESLLKQIYNMYISLRSRYLVEPPPLPPEMRQQLIEIFREDILQLQDLIQRDLSKWLE